MLTGRWAPEVREALLQRLQGPPGLAAFDFDNTLIHNDLGEACMYYILFQGLVAGDREEFWKIFQSPASVEHADVAAAQSAWALIRDSFAEDTDALLSFAALCLQLYDRIYHSEGMAAAYRWSRIFFSFMPVEELQRIARYVFESECMRELNQARIGPELRIPQGLRVIEELRALIAVLLEKKWQVRVVTASPELVISAVVEDWGLRAADVLGMRLYESAGELRPEILEPYPIQQGKVECLLEKAGATPDLAVGDSRGDAEMLEAAGLAILIDREIPDLRQRLQTHGALLQPRFIQPV
ncbi:MAG: hypothetical protein K1X75_10310 [Leptospirales bacterium]|nr:hypothetical protein [Leptospirales bacterium]